MSRPRKVPDADRCHQLDGAPPPEGTHTSRRARATQREQERLSTADEARLDATEMAEGVRFTRRQLQVLDAIASGLPVKNAREVIAALRLKADFALVKPATQVDLRAVTYTLVDPYAESPSALLPLSAAPELPAIVESPALPAPAEEAAP